MVHGRGRRTTEGTATEATAAPLRRPTEEIRMAAHAPTPTGPAAPGPRASSSRGSTAAPNIWSYEPGDPPRRRPRRPRGLPHRHPRRLHRPAASSCCPGSSSHTCSRGRRRAASSSGCARAPGSATSPSTSRCSCSRRPATTCAAARPARSRASPGVYNVIYGYADETRRPRRRHSSRCACVNHLVQAEEGFDFAEELDAVPAPGRADGLRPVDRGHPRGGGHAATSPTSGSTQPRSSSSARASTPSASGPR